MSPIKIQNEFGIVLRLASLGERQVPWDRVLAALDVEKPLDRDEFIASFGPHFGREALDAMMARLNALGLIYVDDYFDIAIDLPGLDEPERQWAR